MVRVSEPAGMCVRRPGIGYARWSARLWDFLLFDIARLEAHGAGGIVGARASRIRGAQRKRAGQPAARRQLLGGWQSRAKYDGPDFQHLDRLQHLPFAERWHAKQ